MSRVKLKDVCTVIVPMRDKPKEFVDSTKGIPWCRIEDIEGKFLNDSLSHKYVNETCISQMNLKVFPTGTVLCAVTGASIGKYAITTKELITNQTFAGIVCGEKIFNEYLYYFIKQLTNYFINNSVGCAQAYITRESLENLEFDLPPIDTQKKIVSILCNLDSKIENNNKTISELESLAKDIYNYWFLQFEFPNEEGKPYKSSGGKMVWNDELNREIPEGWKITKLGKLTKCILGGTPSRDNPKYWNGDINWINSSKVNELRISEPSETITEKGLNESSTSLLPKNTTVLAITGATLGQISILNIDSCANQSVIGILENNELPTVYIYPYITNSMKGIINNQTGAAQPHVNKNDIENIYVLLPNCGIMGKYKDKVDGTYTLIMNLCSENLKLSQLRDFLLPMLMNGQVSFKD